MTTGSDRVSAKIYQFPARGRIAANGVRGETQAAQSNAPQLAKAAVGSGWYHEAAIVEEAERARIN